MFWWLEQNKYWLTKVITQMTWFHLQPPVFNLLVKHWKAGKQGGHGKCRDAPAFFRWTPAHYPSSKRLILILKKCCNQQLSGSWLLCVLKVECKRYSREQHLFTFEGPKWTPLEAAPFLLERALHFLLLSFLFEVMHTYLTIWYMFWLFSFTE